MKDASIAKWVEDTAGLLIASGHSAQAIPDYTYMQFMVYAQVAERREAHRRNRFVSDITTVAAGLYAKKGENPIGDHLASLESTYFEDNKDGKPKRSRRLHKRARQPVSQP